MTRVVCLTGGSFLITPTSTPILGLQWTLGAVFIISKHSWSLSSLYWCGKIVLHHDVVAQGQHYIHLYYGNILLLQILS